MDITAILIPTGILGGMGLLFGVLLAFAAQKLHVHVDERLEQARQCLPGANCGGCGFPGCDGFADAVIKGEAPVDGCPVGGLDVARELGALMGVEAPEDGPRMSATVICRGTDSQCGVKYDYTGMHDCRAAAYTAEGAKACRYACLGLGTCASVCPFGAITMSEGIAKVDPDKCKACKRCVAICPKRVLRIEPVDNRVMIKCRATKHGKAVRDACTAGCLACGKCARVCHFGAITMENDLPVLDRDVCVGCLQCASACPTGAMWGKLEDMSYARVEDTCIGCGKCNKVCRFEAIRGEGREQRSIIEDKCAGCNQCRKVCPKGSIRMIKRGS